MNDMLDLEACIYKGNDDITFK